MTPRMTGILSKAAFIQQHPNPGHIHWNCFMLELQVLNNKTRDMVKAFALGDTDELIIGRDEGCDIRINSASISREHCSIEQNGQDTFLRDLDSSGGTYFDGERINEIRIEDGMEFSIGPAILKFIDSGL